MSSVDRRQFLRASGIGVAGAAVMGPKSVWPDERAMLRAESEASDSFELLRAEQARRKAELPPPADFHRLPLAWHKAKTQELKEQARERGVDGGLFLTNRWNIIYATGLHHSTTERPFAVFLPMDDDEAAIWFYPYLDEQLVKSWWFTDGYYYFDYHHSLGGFPNQGQVVQGPTVNLPAWWGETLEKIGYGGKTLGIDVGGAAEIGVFPGQREGERLDLLGRVTTPTAYRPSGGTFGEMAAAMPSAQFVDVYDIFMRGRVVKDEMEQRLVQRAEDIASEVHAFARNYILEKGLGTIDQEVSNAARLWASDRIMTGIPQQGEPHNAVGITFNVSCRTGRVTGYPHPNQQSWSPIQRGDALQVSTWGGLGGYGGEQYRSYLIAPWTPRQERVWEVHTRSYEIQAEESYEGNTASNVAKAVHDYQVQNEMENLIYHRPGHGEGMEGHQPPYQSLGDYTVLRKGMMFSNEPGLYDPDNGFGFNHSNNILVWDEKGLQQGTAPVSKEWCFLEVGQQS